MSMYMGDQYRPEGAAEYTAKADRSDRQRLVEEGWKPGQRRRERILRQPGQLGGLPVTKVVHLPKLR